MLVTSIFFFSHDVFKRPFPPVRQKSPLCGKRLTLTKQALVFTCLHYKSFENTVGKGEITHNFHQI